MSEQTVVLASKQGDTFVVPGSAASLSGVVKRMDDFDTDSSDVEIPLPEVSTHILQKVVEYMLHFRDEPQREIEKPLKSSTMDGVVQQSYFNFLQVDQETLFELILAANFMEIQPLLDLTCATVAGMTKGKSPQQLKDLFHIGGELKTFTPEEEAQIRQMNPWAEEP